MSCLNNTNMSNVLFTRTSEMPGHIQEKFNGDPQFEGFYGQSPAAAACLCWCWSVMTLCLKTGVDLPFIISWRFFWLDGAAADRWVLYFCCRNPWNQSHETLSGLISRLDKMSGGAETGGCRFSLPQPTDEPRPMVCYLACSFEIPPPPPPQH